MWACWAALEASCPPRAPPRLRRRFGEAFNESSAMCGGRVRTRSQGVVTITVTNYCNCNSYKPLTPHCIKSLVCPCNGSLVYSCRGVVYHSYHFHTYCSSPLHQHIISRVLPLQVFHRCYVEGAVHRVGPCSGHSSPRRQRRPSGGGVHEWCRGDGGEHDQQGGSGGGGDERLGSGRMVSIVTTCAQF